MTWGAGLTIFLRGIRRGLLGSPRVSRAAARETRALTQTIAQLGVLYALDLEARGIPTTVVKDALVARSGLGAALDALASDVELLAEQNRDRLRMTDEDFATQEQIDRAIEANGGRALTDDQQAALLDAIAASRHATDAHPLAADRARRPASARAFSSGGALPFLP